MSINTEIVASEQELDQPPIEAGTVSSDPAGSLISAVKDIPAYTSQQILTSVNANQAPALIAPPSLPQLVLVTLAGYQNNVATPVVGTQLGGFLMEKFTAYDFIAMSYAIFKALGVTLSLTQAFRTYAQQQALFLERQQPGVGSQKGPAARPGYSNHQMGVSLDIDMGYGGHAFTKFAAGQYPPIYQWMVANAINYGFDQHDLGTIKSGPSMGKPCEPWHWTHISQKVYASAPAEDYLTTLFSPAAAAEQAVNSSQVGLSQLQGQAAYETISQVTRSALMSGTTRQTAHDNWAEYFIHNSARQNQYAANVSAVSLQTTGTFPQMTSANVLTFDYSTGLWGDGSAT